MLLVSNLGSGCPCILRDFVSMLRDNIDNSLPLGFGEVPYRNDQVMHLVADISRLTAATGWMPKISTQEGILRTIEWHRRRGDYLD